MMPDLAYPLHGGTAGAPSTNPPPAAGDNFQLFCSGAIEGVISHAMLGSPHYSYRFAEECFRRMFIAAGASLTKLAMPEYYATASAFPPSQLNQAHAGIHLIFRSTEEIRLLKFGYNIACFAWEFDVLKDNTFPDEHPFLNQKRMLNACDEIWVPSTYTQRVLSDHGVRNVLTIPAPILVREDTARDRLEALARLSRVVVAPLHVNFLLPPSIGAAICRAGEMSLGEWLGETLRRKPDVKIYLSIFNPEDFRKNVDALIRGFVLFAERNPGCVLIVKVLTSAARFKLGEAIADVICSKLASGTVLESASVVFFNDYLEQVDLSWLYRLADFYLCTSFAEGQNLPLLEAMRHGAVPVTTRSTAMLDYISEDNSVIIRTQRRANDCVHLAGCATGKAFDIDWCSYLDVIDALEASTRLTREQIARMSADAEAVAEARYSVRAVWELVRARLTAITGARRSQGLVVGASA